MRATARWRDPALGSPRELDLPQGRLRCFEAGDGPPIVFVHGLFVNANVWRKVVPRLRRDFHCVALDLPFGGHELPLKPDADLSERGLVNLIVDAIEALDLDEVTLVGMDTGGAICQFLVTQRPERIGRLVLCSCDYRDNFPPRRFFHVKLLPAIGDLAPVLLAPLRWRPLRRLPNVFGALSHRQVEPAAEDTYILPGMEDRDVRRDVNKAIGVFDKKRLNQAADRLSTFERPALIAWSRDDVVFPPEHGERLAEELPNARLEWIDRARTMSMEDQPARLAEVIASFVREPQEATV
jgi:pimeloyl-ACP methyl ester carboxylesterase